MISCDRASLLALAEGTLLSRDADGVCIVGDRPECHAALEAIERGETVLLTVGGRVVSRVVKGVERLEPGILARSRKP